jgi:acyl carrier protein
VARAERGPKVMRRTTMTATKESLKEQLRALVAEIAEKDEIPEGASFKELGIDSMMGVEIVAAIERQYQIKVLDEELAGFKDLTAAYTLVVKKLEEKSAIAAAE